jgi:hypothetical protein
VDMKLVQCPFHEGQEKTLAIDLETGRYHCDVCGARGLLTPSGEAQLLTERRARPGTSPTWEEVREGLRQVGPADQFM